MKVALEFIIRFHRAASAVGCALVLLISASGCTRAAKSDADPAILRVAAASDLRNVFPRLSERFEQTTGIRATASFGASGQLSAQIKQGAPFDIFLAANRPFIDDLAAHGLIKVDSVRPYARGSLVLALHRDAADHVRSLEDLTKPTIKRIALANPDTAPYGKAGKQALERAGLFRRLEPKIVVAESVGQAMIYAQKGDAEAALIGRAIAQAPEIRVVEIDATLYDPIIQALGILTSSKRSAGARAFAEFVLGEDGQRILAEFGLAQDKSANLQPSPKQ